MYDSYFVWAIHSKKSAIPIVGKWLVFKHYDELDETWRLIRTAVLEQKLSSCVKAKCSTLKYNPSTGGPGPKTNGVICVYTGENDMDDIGFKLIEIIKQSITYKLDEFTRAGIYSHQGAKTSTKTLYWNEGKPSFEGKRSFRRSGVVDRWQINVVRAPEPLRSETICGRWIVYLPTGVMTAHWHMLKKDVESKDSNFGVIKMECPKASKKNPPCFLFFTSKERKDKVGETLSSIFDCKIEYKEEDDF